MASQESIILSRLITNLRKKTAPDLTDDNYFELFVNEQVLKDYDLSYDELKFGNIGQGGDGGIDGFYIFVNHLLYQSDTDLSDIKKNIEIHLLQAKNRNRLMSL